MAYGKVGYVMEIFIENDDCEPVVHMMEYDKETEMYITVGKLNPSEIRCDEDAKELIKIT